MIEIILGQSLRCFNNVFSVIFQQVFIHEICLFDFHIVNIIVDNNIDNQDIDNQDIYNQDIDNQDCYYYLVEMRKLYDQLVDNARQKGFQQNLRTFKQSQRAYQQRLQEGKQKVIKDFNAKVTLLNAQKRIKRSSLINHFRMLKATRKQKFLEQIFQQVQARLAAYIRSNPKQYQFVLLTYIVQGVIRMFQQQCFIRCLSRDVPLIQQVIQDSISTYNHVMKQEIGREYAVQLVLKSDPLAEREISKNIFLQKKDEDSQCMGGVILTDITGNITYKNTMDTRVNILKEICLPDVRRMLWS